MRADNLKFHPIRLQMKRIQRGNWNIYRGNWEELNLIGKVTHHSVRNNLHYWPSEEDRPWNAFPAKSALGGTAHSSFKGACLRLARLPSSLLSADRIQDYGDVRMLRINASEGLWYTVVFHKHGTLIYDDHTIQKHGTALSDQKQATLRSVLRAAEDWKKENL